MQSLSERVRGKPKREEGEIHPAFAMTRRATLAEAPALDRIFRDEKDGCIKVVLRP